MSVSWRWLGIACIEIDTGDEVLLIDPYLSRIPFRKAYFGRIKPDVKASQFVDRCDYILVTHSHFDHLLDAPPIALRTGARLFGSPNTARLAVSLGIPPDRVRTVHAGENLAAGRFRVKVFAYKHTPLPGYNPGELPRVLRPPLRARDYRLDLGCCYHITAGRTTFLTDPGIEPSVNVQADILFTQPYHNLDYYRKLLDTVRPKQVVPLHWDNLFNRTDKKPYFRPPSFNWPPLKRIDFDDFTRTIHAVAPDVKVIIPAPLQIFKTAP